jgi:hypothetical protein
MAPSTTLAFRPRQDPKRVDTPAPVAVMYTNLAFRSPPASNNSHVTHTHRHPNATAGPIINDKPLTLENLSLNTSVAGRVQARRRRAPVNVFIEKKGVVKRPLARKPQRSRQALVFGVASLMDAATYNLAVALSTKPPGARIVNLEDLGAQVLPADSDTTVHVNDHENLNRGFMDGEGVNAVVVAENSHCPCGGLGEDQGGLIACITCKRAYHPVCVGKGRHGHADLSETVSQHLDDVQYHLQNAFSCPDCDRKASAKQHSTLSGKEIRAEKERRKSVFAKRTALPADETEPRVCDSCQFPIIGARYECRYHEAFDLCAECWVDPEITSKHQHIAGDKKWHYH